MIEIPTMLMIGAAARNAGKTAFACGVIRKFAPDCDVVAVKVTTIAEKNGNCPRGGKGCGVCSSLEGDFDITEEVSTSSDKDTAQLLAAGATKVFWLRVLKDSMEQGLRALIDVIGPNPCVCESNSLRLAVKPGLFIMVKNRYSDDYKPSARAVADFIDKIISFDGKDFDIATDSVCFVDGKWTFRNICEVE